MTARRAYRLIGGAALLTLLCITIALTAPGRLPTYWPTLPLGMVAIGVIGYWVWLDRCHAERIAYYTNLLRGAAWDLVRGMENYPPRAAGRRAKGRAELVERFAFKAAEGGRPLPMGDAGTLDLSTVGLEVVERNEADGSGHWRRVNGIRRGAYAFYALFQLDDPAVAFRALTDHMKVQARFEVGSMPNHTELKMLFGLPVEWPAAGAGERYEVEGLGWRREMDIRTAVDAGRAAVFDQLNYRTWPEDEPDGTERDYKGEEILERLRLYIR